MVNIRPSESSDGFADRLVALERAVDIDRPELPADAAGVEPRHVGHQGVIAPGVGAAGEVGNARLLALGELFGDVIVAVDQRCRLENPVDPRPGGRVDRLGGCLAGNGEGGEAKDEGAHGVTLRGRRLRSMERE